LPPPSATSLRGVPVRRPDSASARPGADAPLAARLRPPVTVSCLLPLLLAGHARLHAEPATPPAELSAPLAERAVRPFRIPAADASESLAAFGRQADTAVVYVLDQVSGIRTRALDGRYRSRAALELLLSGTPLRVSEDPGTGALLIKRQPPTEPPPSPTPTPPVKSQRTKRLAGLLPAILSAFASSETAAQTVAPAPAAPAPITLSPFEVNTDRDRGYVATSTLAGTRMNSDLWDTPAAISVFTTEFLADTGVLDVKSALDYGLNTSQDTTDYTGQAQASNDINVQIRGFTGAAIGRNYFAWRLSSDRFNIERIDFSRGPNSVLFGVGAPGGIINTSTKRARPGRDTSALRLRVGSWDDYRVEYDYEQTLLRDRLAVRANLLRQDKNDWREFRSSTRSAGALAVTYRPFKDTEIRFDGEYGDVDQILVQAYSASENFLPWVAQGRPISAAYGQAVPGAGANNNVRLVWDPFAGTGPVSWNGARVTTGAAQASALANVRAAILDEAIHPRKGAISGPGWTGDFHYFNYALFAEQRVGENLTVEAAFNRQHEMRFQYRPQGFGQITLRVDPNAFRPAASNGAGIVTATEPNPNVGRYYTDGDNYRLQIADRTIDDYRLTTSYRLDFTRRSRWLGRHDVAGLLSSTDSFNRDDELASRNITPAGTATYPLDLTNGNNLIIRKSYIDFANPDPRWRGLFDPRRFPLTGQNGVTEGLVRTDDVARDGRSTTNTAMLAAQSRWLGGRIVLTGGWRRDRLRVWEDSMDFDRDGNLDEHRAPVTRLTPRRQRTGSKSFAMGDTKTFGTVLHPAPWLAVFYNRSDSFQPQSAEDITGGLIGNRKGEGEDYGLRFRLWNDRINASLARYTTDDSNQVIGRDNNFINFINSIWRSIGQPNRQTLTSSRDSQGLSGEGLEFEVTANPTPNWRLAVNAAQTRQVASSLHPRNGAYLEANRGLWRQFANVPLGSEIVAGIPATDPATGAPATVTTALTEVDRIYAAMVAGSGQTRRQLREYTGNVFTTYAFRGAGSWLRGLSVGGGINYRGKGVVGYDAVNNNAAIYGPAYTLANAMVSYAWRPAKRSVRLQLNVDNLGNEVRPILTDASETQEFRYIFQTPRRFALTTTIEF
jgi:outer membrane receptor protein involved in Fe transport